MFQALKEYNHVVFLVAQPTVNKLAGVADLPGKYSFIFTDNLGGRGPEVVAHEVGHNLDLKHTQGWDDYGNLEGGPKDPDNVMHPTLKEAGTLDKLRFYQWSVVNKQQ